MRLRSWFFLSLGLFLAIITGVALNGVAQQNANRVAAAAPPETVSVVVATRNYGRYLAGALRSILDQTWRDLEVVVIDDGSNDDTPVILRPFLADARVRSHRTDGLGRSSPRTARPARR